MATMCGCMLLELSTIVGACAVSLAHGIVIGLTFWAASNALYALALLTIPS